MVEHLFIFLTQICHNNNKLQEPWFKSVFLISRVYTLWKSTFYIFKALTSILVLIDWLNAMFLGSLGNRKTYQRYLDIQHLKKNHISLRFLIIYSLKSIWSYGTSSSLTCCKKDVVFFKKYFLLAFCPLSVCLYTFHIFYFFFKTSGPSLIKLGTKHF